MHIKGTVDSTAVRKHLRSVPSVVRGHVRRRLSYWGRYIVNSIQKDRTLFEYSEGRPARPDGLSLQSNGLWTKRDQSDRDKQLMGWSVPWGEVLEFGPRRKKRWDIEPKGFRSDATMGRSGGGQALSFLRFQKGGKICYARKVTHVWDDSQKRPHFEPHMEKHSRGFHQDLGSIPQRVIEGKLR